jgi:uncharacterized membrane protein
MSRYDLYLAIHIVAAMVWVGTAFAMVTLATRAVVARDRDRVMTFVREGDWLGLHVFLPTNVLVATSAALLIREGGWGYGQLWIRLGLLGFAVSFVVGVAVFAPGWGRVLRTARNGAGTPDVEPAVRRLLMVSWLDLGWLLSIVFVMTVKPASGEWTALGVAAAIPVVSGLLGMLLLYGPGRRGLSGAPAEGPS